MKSIAILFFLAFLTGFQAAVLNEERLPSNSEPKQQSVPEQSRRHSENFSSQQSILEQLQDHFGKLSTQVTETINDGLGTMKGHLSDTVVYLAETGKKHIPTKLYNRKASNLVKEAQQYGQSLLNQGKEAVKDQIQKVVSMVDEIKKHPVVMTLNEEVIDPVIKGGHKFISLVGDQSLASISTTIQKNMKF